MFDNTKIKVQSFYNLNYLFPVKPNKTIFSLCTIYIKKINQETFLLYVQKLGIFKLLK